jgi:hypothetical protein
MMAKEQLTESINIKIEPSAKESLQRIADELYPEVPGNASVLVRAVIKKALAEHDAKKRKS